MKGQLQVSSKYLLGVASAFFLIALGIDLAFFPFNGQFAGANELPQERELFNTLPGSDGKNKLLDSTNPLDLLNSLRRATAMDNATSPVDAIDAALRDLELYQSQPTALKNNES